MARTVSSSSRVPGITLGSAPNQRRRRYDVMIFLKTSSRIPGMSRCLEIGWGGEVLPVMGAARDASLRGAMYIMVDTS